MRWRHRENGASGTPDLLPQQVGDRKAPTFGRGLPTFDAVRDRGPVLILAALGTKGALKIFVSRLEVIQVQVFHAGGVGILMRIYIDFQDV